MRIGGRNSHRDEWALLVAGPALWFGHFMAVYLMVEAGCAADEAGGPQVLGLDLMALVTLAATVVAAGAAALVGLAARRRWREEGPPGVLAGGEGASGIALTATVLGAFSVIAILFTGFPAVLLEPC